MAQQAALPVRVACIDVRDASYGGFERDGETVAFVERRAVSFSPGWGMGVITDVMVTHPGDIAIADVLAFAQWVTVRLMSVGYVGPFGKAEVRYKKPAGDDPVFVGDVVDERTGEVLHGAALEEGGFRYSKG
jgi:hypothetical protein